MFHSSCFIRPLLILAVLISLSSTSQAQLPLTFDGGQGTVIFDFFLNLNNDMIGFDLIGRELTIPTGSGLVALGEVALGDTLTPGMSFSNAGVADGSAFSGTGTAYVGFEDNSNNVGFFQVNFSTGINDNEVVYSEGQIATGGNSLAVGPANVVPEPSSLTLLSLAAFVIAGKRRRSSSLSRLAA